MTDRQGDSSRPAPGADEKLPGTTPDEVAAQLLAARQKLAVQGRQNKQEVANLRKSLRPTQPAGDEAAAGDTAEGEGNTIQKPAGSAAQDQPADSSKGYTIPRLTPERPTAQEESDSARASRSRDEKSTDQQTASQQQRSGAHPPQRLAGALAKAADPVQDSIDQAQQSMNIASAMQHAADRLLPTVSANTI